VGDGEVHAASKHPGGSIYVAYRLISNMIRIYIIFAKQTEGSTHVMEICLIFSQQATAEGRAWLGLDSEPARFVILTSQKASSQAKYKKKYTKYNIYIYLKPENSNNIKVTHPIALNRKNN
jgi:hypothetical protein